MKPLILFGDRISHPFRACLMLLKAGSVAGLEEKTVNLMKGEQHKLKELPLKQVPVLRHGEKVITQSTTILRYTAANFCKSSWYEDPKIRFLIDEYFDFWQSSKNPPLFLAVRNRCFYKELFKLDAPNEDVIEKNVKEFRASLTFFDNHFMKGGPFIGGSKSITIGDLLASNTLEQAKLVDGKFVNDVYGDYLIRCTEQVEEYSSIVQELDKLKIRINS